MYNNFKTNSNCCFAHRRRKIFVNTRIHIFQLSLAAGAIHAFSKEEKRGILKAVTSRGISGELVDSGTISINDFSGRT